MPPLDGLRVGVSGIDGYGVFTTRAFAKGEVVVHADGVVHDDGSEFDDTYALVMPRDRKNPAAGLVYLDLIDQTRWINHSCDPNLMIEAIYDPETRTVRAHWYARRAIAAGEELSFDYAFDGTYAVPCGCGSPACRGLIVDLDPRELDQVAEELRPFLRIAVPAREV